MTDNELIAKAKGGDRLAMDLLLLRYRGMIRKLSGRYFAPGADRDDLVQAAYLGVWHAALNFSPDRGVQFSAFAAMAIRRRLHTAVKMANREKHRLQNAAASLDAPLNEDMDFTLQDQVPGGVSPEQEYMAKEMYEAIKRIATPLEWTVFIRIRTGNSYCDIAEELGLSRKAVDNALQRLRKKTRRSLLREAI